MFESKWPRFGGSHLNETADLKSDLSWVYSKYSAEQGAPTKKNT